MILASSKSSPEMQNQLQTEIDFICGDNKPFLSQPAATSEVWMDPPIEEPVLVRKWSSQVQTVRVSLPRGRLYTRIRFSAAGLSPLCSHAYFLNEDSILVYSLSSHGGSLEDNPILRRDALKTRYKAAALSERFVAVLLENSIQVYQYNGPEAGGLRSDIETNGYQWNPRSLIAIHETSERTWIAIGGSTKVDGILSGSIKIYSVEEHNETASLRELPISFTRPKPNPLALDFLKTLAFRPDGQMLVCATNNNRVLIWRLSNQGAPYEAPFIIKKDLNRVSRVRIRSLQSGC